METTLPNARDQHPLPPEDTEGMSSATATAGDSMAVAAWTLVSRVTGLAKFAAIGAVLGPTFFGNTYQFTNSLPNLVYYGFLAGSLFSSLLIPALVKHIDTGDRRASERVAGGFLGATAIALLAISPVSIVIGPLLLRATALTGDAAAQGATQEHVARWLIVMFIPQVFFYGVVGTATAVMNARRRFALAAAAPALENVGIVAVLAATAFLFGTAPELGTVPSGELLLLGLGTTGAVALHASAQWWGAKRAGVTLVPRPGWRDPEVRVVIWRALPSVGQAGLQALQTLTLLLIANRVAGGVVAFQIALNFYYLALAMGATPVALSLLPRLARMHLNGNAADFRDTLLRGFALGFFVTIPAAVAYIALATPLARAVSFGKMGSTAGFTMVAVCLATLAPAVVAQTAFMIATYAAYARKDTHSPLRSMFLQAALCLVLLTGTLLMRGTLVLVALGLTFSVSITLSAVHLTSRLRRELGRSSQRLLPSLVKAIAGSIIMAGPARLIATLVSSLLAGAAGEMIGVSAGALVGGAIYLVLQALWKTPEVNWIAGGLSHLRTKAKQAAVGARNG